MNPYVRLRYLKLSECISNPRTIRAQTRAGDNQIESAGPITPGIEALQIVLRGPSESGDLCLGYAAQRATVTLIATVTHLDEHDVLVVFHDQIDFTAPAAIVGTDVFHAVFKQELTGAVFRQ